MQWLLSRGTIVFHHLYRFSIGQTLFLSFSSHRHTRQMLLRFVNSNDRLWNPHMPLITTAEKPANHFIRRGRNPAAANVFVVQFDGWLNGKMNGDSMEINIIRWNDALSLVLCQCHRNVRTCTDCPFTVNWNDFTTPFTGWLINSLNEAIVIVASFSFSVLCLDDHVSRDEC